MKKTIAILSLCLATVCGAMAQKTTKIMTVEQKDGTTVTYKVKDIQRVTFTDKEPVTLENQWAYNDDVKNIGAVTLSESEGYYTICLYGSENPQADEAYDVKFFLPTSMAGTTIDLSSTNQVGVFKGENSYPCTGTLQVKFDKFFKQVTIALEAEIAGNEFRAAYKGTFKRTYDATNAISVALDSETAAEADIATAFTVLPTATGEATQFAFVDGAGATPADVKTTSKYAVWVNVSASKLYAGDIDMATETDSYSFHYIDYATGTTYTTVTSGTISTAQDYLGNAYVHVNATLEDGTVVDCEYAGAYTTVESLEDLIPTPIIANGWHYYDSDGNETTNASVNKVLYKVNSSNGYTTYYFYQNADDSKYTSDKVTLQVKDEWVNAGKKDLSNLADGDWFSIKYSDIQLVSPDSKYSGYGLVPNNGTLTISKDDEGNYDIYLDITNLYNCSGTSIVNGGNNARLVLSYKGQMTGTY